MSRDGYAGYTLSGAERARLERERQRRLEEERRRQEEEARREAERLRKEMVAAQKKRVQWAADFQATPMTAGGREPEKAAPRTQRGSPTPAVRTGDDRMSEREKTETQLQRLKTRLDAFPAAWRMAHEAQLARLYHLVELVEKERRTNFLYHYETLRRAEQELLNLVATAARDLAERDRLLEASQVRIQRMLGSLQVICRLTARDDHRREGKLLLSRLRRMYELPNADEVKRELASLETAVEDIDGQFRDLQQREQERERVLALLRQTLHEMGYESLELGPDRVPPAGSSIRLAFRTPDQEVLETDLDLSRSLHFSFKHAADRHEGDAAPVSRDELIARARRWCKDYEAIKQRWLLEGIELEDKWIQAPEEGQIETVALGRVEASLTDEERRLLEPPLDRDRVIE